MRLIHGLEYLDIAKVIDISLLPSIDCFELKTEGSYNKTGRI